jgi:hypothetical protein
MNSAHDEKYTSAITLSDMEIFIFPELIYSLVLADIMSPAIWQWREENCFKKLDGKSSFKKLMRLKQFIMDEYDFNLDNQAKELNRFKDIVSPEDIAASNALFGYHGDKYYFDVDIRKHFGLDKYDSDVIPYWKTETVEAMNAFHRRQGYSKAAGECVSLSALYAAAAFIVCGIPLEDIYMILTPLHSQNFIDINGGVLTNNRRLITKVMWFNGTAISNKAQRALRNEQVTIVAHNTGFVHCLYKDVTMEKGAYEKFLQKLGEYLTTDLTTLTVANFLRCYPKYQKYFQFCCEQCRGGAKFAAAEVLFHYEHGSKFRIADNTFEKLIEEVSEEDISPYKLPDRVCANQLQSYVEYENIDVLTPAGRAALTEYLAPFVGKVDDFLADLVNFMHFEPKTPSLDRNFINNEPIRISPAQDRKEIIDYLQAIRQRNTAADLAFYAYRDMETCDWRPFIKAAVERNPVSIEMTRSMQLEDVYAWLEKMPGESIYDDKRLAQPDEVANYNCGDGLEKAFLLANVIRQRNPEQNLEIDVGNQKVTLKGKTDFQFVSDKGFNRQIGIPEDMR